MKTLLVALILFGAPVVLATTPEETDDYSDVKDTGTLLKREVRRIGGTTYTLSFLRFGAHVEVLEISTVKNADKILERVTSDGPISLAAISGGLKISYFEGDATDRPTRKTKEWKP